MAWRDGLTPNSLTAGTSLTGTATSTSVRQYFAYKDKDKDWGETVTHEEKSRERWSEDVVAPVLSRGRAQSLLSCLRKSRPRTQLRPALRSPTRLRLRPVAELTG